MRDLTTMTREELDALNNELGQRQNDLRTRRFEAHEAAEAAFLRDREPLRAARAAITTELERRSAEGETTP